MLRKLPEGWSPEQLSDEWCKYERELMLYLTSQGLLAENTAIGVTNALVNIINGDVESLPIDKINDLIVSMIGLAMRDFLADMAKHIAERELQSHSMMDSMDKFLKDQGLSGIN